MAERGRRAPSERIRPGPNCWDPSSEVRRASFSHASSGCPVLLSLSPGRYGTTTIGRPTLMTGQEGTEKCLFPLIAKLRLELYGNAPDDRLERLVEKLLG